MLGKNVEVMLDMALEIMLDMALDWYDTRKLGLVIKLIEKKYILNTMIKWIIFHN